MIEYKKWYPRPQLEIVRKEPKQWFADFYTIALYKQDFDIKDVEKVQQITCVDKNIYWKQIPIKSEKDVFFAFKSDSSTHNSNQTEFDRFLIVNFDNPKYKDRYVVFVNGVFQGVDDVENKLVKKIHEEFGNVEMYVGKITLESDIHIIDTPELR